MNFTQSDEDRQLRASVRSLLTDKSSETAVRAAVDAGGAYDAGLWSTMAEHLGLVGLTVPEQSGGVGGTEVEVGLVLRELGRAMTVSPYFATAVLGVQCLLRCGQADIVGDLLSRAAAGDLTIALAYRESTHEPGVGPIHATAACEDGTWRVTGTKRFVIDGCTAGLLLVLADAPDGMRLFTVDPSQEGVERTPELTLDPTRPLAQLELKAVKAVPVGAAGEGESVVEAALDRGRLALASEQAGVARRALEIAVDYAKVREQFGRPIGSFQAVKHMCADMLVDVESAEAAADYGLVLAARDDVDVPVLAPLIAATCSEAAVAVTKNAVQVLGGIGFTWEHPMHFYLKRAKSSALLLGQPSVQREVFMTKMGL